MRAGGWEVRDYTCEACGATASLHRWVGDKHHHWCPDHAPDARLAELGQQAIGLIRDGMTYDGVIAADDRLPVSRAWLDRYNALRAKIRELEATDV